MSSKGFHKGLCLVYKISFNKASQLDSNSRKIVSLHFTGHTIHSVSLLMKEMIYSKSAVQIDFKFLHISEFVDTVSVCLTVSTSIIL